MELFLDHSHIFSSFKPIYLPYQLLTDSWWTPDQVLTDSRQIPHGLLPDRLLPDGLLSDRLLTDSWRTLAWQIPALAPPPNGHMMDTQMEPLMECLTDTRETIMTPWYNPDGFPMDWGIPDRLQEIDFNVSIWRAGKMRSSNLESCPNELSKFAAHLERSSDGPPMDPWRTLSS